MTSCRLCKRDCAPSSDFCRYHLTAKQNVEFGYKRWSEAYGAITWKDYLQRIGKNAQTGEWAKEVAELLTKEAAERPRTERRGGRKVGAPKLGDDPVQSAKE